VENCFVSNSPLVKIKAAAAAEVCVNFDLKKEAQPLLTNGISPRAFLDALVANTQYLAGIDFLCHALAPRDAIWWGCLTLQHACGNDLSEQDKAACKAAVRWIFAPTDENREAAKLPADVAGPASAAGGLASAASFTGGSVAPPKAPPTPPPPFAPKAVAGAIKLATTKADPVRIAETQKLYLELGIAIAEGRHSHTEMRGMTAIRA
jgi:hypothetical protein